MGGGGRVLTQTEQNAKYLDSYINFTKHFKHLDIIKGEIEFSDDCVLNSSFLISIINGFDFIKNNRKILIKIEKMLLETKDVDKIINNYFYGNSNYSRFRSLRNPNSEEFLGENLWSDIENLICTDSELSYTYANLLQSRFELGEKSIAKDPKLSLSYARNIIKGRFELGEKSISKKNEYIYDYAKIIGLLPNNLFGAMKLNLFKKK